MHYADEQSYETMINALQNFLSQLEEQCAVMEAAAQDCVDNTNNDQAAEKASAKMKKCTNDIRGNFESIQQVIHGLSEELEKLRRANEEANFDD